MGATGKSTSSSRTPIAADVEAYIASQPKAAQPHLRELRRAIRAEAPRAEERISYGIVGYFYPTRLVYFGGAKHHVALYPAYDAKGLEKYRYGASTLRFPLDQRLPIARIRALVRAQVRARDAAAKASRIAGPARRARSGR